MQDDQKNSLIGRVNAAEYEGVGVDVTLKSNIVIEITMGGIYWLEDNPTAANLSKGSPQLRSDRWFSPLQITDKINHNAKAVMFYEPPYEMAEGLIRINYAWFFSSWAKGELKTITALIDGTVDQMAIDRFQKTTDPGILSFLKRGLHYERN